MDNNKIEFQLDSTFKWILESTIAPLERTIKRLWILCILLIVLLVGSNVCWLYYESQFEVSETTTRVQQETDNGYNNYIGNDGDIHNGETDNNGDN